VFPCHANSREPCSRITASRAASIVAHFLQLLLACAGGCAQTAAAQQRGEQTALWTSNAPATSLPRTGWRVLERGRAIIRVPPRPWAQTQEMFFKKFAAVKSSCKPSLHELVFLFTFLFTAFERPNQPPSPRAHRSGRRLGLCGRGDRKRAHTAGVTRWAQDQTVGQRHSAARPPSLQSPAARRLRLKAGTGV
jgi:hypothetical protein